MSQYSRIYMKIITKDNNILRQINEELGKYQNAGDELTYFDNETENEFLFRYSYFPTKISKKQTSIDSEMIYDEFNYFASFIIESDKFQELSKKYPDAEFYFIEEAETHEIIEWKIQNGKYSKRLLYEYGKFYLDAEFRHVEKEEDTLNSWFF